MENLTIVISLIVIVLIVVAVVVWYKNKHKTADASTVSRSNGSSASAGAGAGAASVDHRIPEEVDEIDVEHKPPRAPTKSQFQQFRTTTQYSTEDEVSETIKQNKAIQKQWEQQLDLRSIELRRVFRKRDIQAKTTFTVDQPFTLILYQPYRSGSLKFIANNTQTVVALQFDTSEKHHITLVGQNIPDQKITRILRSDGKLTDSNMTVVRYDPNRNEIIVNTNTYPIYTVLQYIQFDISFRDFVFDEYDKQVSVDGRSIE